MREGIDRGMAAPLSSVNRLIEVSHNQCNERLASVGVYLGERYRWQPFAGIKDGQSLVFLGFVP